MSRQSPSPGHQARPTPPSPSRRPHPIIAGGHRRIDDWYWMRDRSDPELMPHLEAENDYSAASMEHLGGLRETLYSEMVQRIQETDLSVPVKKGPWWYFNKTEQGLQYPLHMRTSTPPGIPAGQDDGSELLLDENDLAQGHGFFSLGGAAISPNHALIAYATDTTGGERHTLRIRDIASGQDLPDEIDDVYYGLAWSADSRFIFYTRPDEAMRPWKLFRHELGTEAGQDVLVHTEPDERYYLGVDTTKDEKFIVISISSKTTSEAWVIPTSDPCAPGRLIRERSGGIEYEVEHWGSRFLLVTNDGAENFRLCWTPEDDTAPARWQDMIAPDPSVKLDGIELFASHIALYERAGGVRRIRTAALDGEGNLLESSLKAIEQPEDVSTAWGSGNAEFFSSVLRYEYTSLVTPRSVYEIDLASGATTLLKRQPVLGGYEPGRYKTWREMAQAPDGTLIPISVVALADQRPDGTSPCLLYGYGAYEVSIDPSFSSLRLSLLDRGVIFAIAHVRGGGELGRPWYTAGKGLAKPNTFSDFIAAADHLADSGWARPDRIVARGGSAGGMLMGAVANMTPARWRAIVAEVPFVDCLTTMLDATLPLTVPEWEEWGNPADDEAIYRCMESYSPYDNVHEQHYPAMLVTAGLEDPRVSYWEPAKWVAKLRCHSPESTVLLKVEMGAGHMGPSGRYDAWREEALVFAFILDQVGLAQPEAGGEIQDPLARNDRS